MNLRAEIRPELWDAVGQQYESGNYAESILAAFHYLRDLLRDGANLDGDGVSLVGQALGGNPPRLRINKYETESEKDEQRGFEQILRGMYQGIRNPRTHDKLGDRREAADAIIVFINYAIGLVSKAKGPFTLDGWLARIFDPDFVGTERYASLLAAEVPPNRSTETLLAIYSRKTEGEGDKLKLVFQALLERTGDDKLGEVLCGISDELSTTQDEAAIRRTMQILPPRLWPQIDEAARLRIENKLVCSIGLGKANPATRKAIAGALGTWARDFVPYFGLRAEFYNALLKKLQGTPEEQAYVALWLWYVFPYTLKEPVSDSVRNRWVWAICQAVLSEPASGVVREKLAESIYRFPPDWRTQILQGLQPLKETDPDYYGSLSTTDGDIPF